MSQRIKIQQITQAAFAPFGDLLDTTGAPDKMINAGLCERYHDRAMLDFGDGRAGLSLFRAEPRTLPMILDMVERHPEGSQTFVPMSSEPFLVIVAPDEGGVPGTPRAFITQPGQAVNYHRGTWHGVLSPLEKPGLFMVLDRIGDGENLEEHWYSRKYLIKF